MTDTATTNWHCPNGCGVVLSSRTRDHDCTASDDPKVAPSEGTDMTTDDAPREASDDDRPQPDLEREG